MHLQELLIENKTVVLDKWINSVLATYPLDSTNFLTRQKDRFANPIGSSVSKGLSDLINAFCSEADGLAELSSDVEHLIKIRAVQDFSPSAAIGFVYDLKVIVFELCQKEKQYNLLVEEWLDFSAKVDRLALKVFDLYMASRERIFKVRINELSRGNHLVADGMTCPSAMMRRELAQKAKVEKNV
ncbi:MAG: hypothetical protein A2511_00920 [Deltaproteobacteria bacterium RIFOXYD12_FULL_50_9]|nr:MAG: hypothetical protein A2511_00920 [Deltaproteobacteria bacterium RIFOXYD12_FULL_50_9]